MKKIILLSVLAGSVLFTHCKKKKDDPTPATTTTTTGNNTTGTNTTGNNTTGNNTTAPTSTSGSLTVNGTTQSFSVSTITPNGFYVIMGTSTGTYSEFDAGFLNGKPGASYTATLSSSAVSPYITFSNSKTTYIASSGKATITVIGATVTVEFTNAVFAADDKSPNITASGKFTAIE